jgi:hydroxymethylpyrimidine pyrophosphatase-like HAD family hydrolase
MTPPRSSLVAVSATPLASVAAAMRCLYVDLDGTLLGPDASLLTGGDGGFSALGVRALEACARVGAEVVIYSGRKQSSVFEAARLIGSSAYIFEIGCGLVLDGELEWVTDGIVPAPGNSIYDQLTASGAPALLLERFAGQLEYHTPWSVDRDVSHLFRGEVDLAQARAILESAGLGWLRLVDNGVVRSAAEQMPGLPVIHAYHLVPAGTSKARAVARHMQARGYAPEECIAVGDSREDLDAASVVGTFWLVANALERDLTLEGDLRARSGVRVTAERYGAGVYEAVVTTLAEQRSPGLDA